MSAAELTLIGSPPRARVSTRFLRSELKIIFGRRRNIAGMGVLAAVPVILAISVRMSSPGQGGGPDFISAIAGNGLFVAFAALAVELPLFLPLAVSAISGDSVAGEANLGTLRYLLAIPAGRTRLLVIKYIALVIFAAAATFLVALVGAIMGLALFGGGDLTLLSGTQTSMADSVWRLILSSLYLAAQFSALGAIGLFISTLTEQPDGRHHRRRTRRCADVHPGFDLTVGLATSLAADTLVDRVWSICWGSDRNESVQRGSITALTYAGVFWLAAWARLFDQDVTSSAAIWPRS